MSKGAVRRRRRVVGSTAERRGCFPPCSDTRRRTELCAQRSGGPGGRGFESHPPAALRMRGRAVA